MKPRIFISSTCYDLKFVREDLADFIRGYDYEPILSENGDIGYTPGQNLDKSCYAAMQTADMVILIIGSVYGSAASGETKDEFEEYISVTRNEFRTAIESGIPVFSMIDKKVMTEYGIYEENIDDIEKKSLKIKFKITKDLNVFRFIKEIKNSVAIPIQEFEKSADIKGFISKQWADMFKNYLVLLKEEKENREIENSVNEMKDLIQKMSVMLDSVGKNVLSKDNPEEYEEVINQQEILSFCNNIANACSVQVDSSVDTNSYDERKKIISKFLECLREIHVQGIISDKQKDYGEKGDEILDLFINKGFFLKRIWWDYIEKVDSKFDLLLDEKNQNMVIKIMVEDGKFFRVIQY